VGDGEEGGDDGEAVGEDGYQEDLEEGAEGEDGAEFERVF